MSSVLEVLERLVIELELPLERAIGHAAPLAQQGDYLIHDRDKVHIIAPLQARGTPEVMYVAHGFGAVRIQP